MVKIVCEQRHIEGFLQKIGKRFYRIRHYKGVHEGKPKFEYHQITLKYVEGCLKEKGVTIDQYNQKPTKTACSSIDQNYRNSNNIVDLDTLKSSSNSKNECGRSLAWFRTSACHVDDPGSNPGDRTTTILLLLGARFGIEQWKEYFCCM
jgi:hypothetical protein